MNGDHSEWWNTVDTPGGGHRIPVVFINDQHYVAWVLDAEADSIQEFRFQSNADHGFTHNVNPPTGMLADGLYPAAWGANGIINRSICHATLDTANDRLWITWQGGYLGQLVETGYIDLTQPGPMYDFTVVVAQNVGGYGILLQYAYGSPTARPCRTRG